VQPADIPQKQLYVRDIFQDVIRNYFFRNNFFTTPLSAGQWLYHGGHAARGSGSYTDGDQMKGNVTTPTRTQQQQQLALLSFSSL